MELSGSLSRIVMKVSGYHVSPLLVSQIARRAAVTSVWIFSDVDAFVDACPREYIINIIHCLRGLQEFKIATALKMPLMHHIAACHNSRALRTSLISLRSVMQPTSA